MEKVVAVEDKSQGGRPSKYEDRFCEDIITYFRQDVIEEIIDTIEGKNFTKTVTRKEASFFPTIEGFADSIGVDDDTIVEWAKARYSDDYQDEKLRGQLKHPAFSAAYTRAKAIQRDLVLRYGITGKFDSRFAQFFAMNNMGMAHREENEQKVIVETRVNRASTNKTD